MKYDILIFVQAAADLRYAISIIEENPQKNIHLYIINVKNIYDFIVTLKINNVKIDFQPYFDVKIKKPKTYFTAKRDINNFWDENFKKHNYKEVYFFSRFYDFLTAAMIGKFLHNKNQKVFYYDHYDTISTQNDKIVSKKALLKFKNQYISLIISYISGVSFISIYRKRYMEFNYKKYPIIRKTPIGIAVSSKYQYKIKNKNFRKNVLFLVSPEELKMLTKPSLMRLKFFFTLLNNEGYKLYIKGHPRLGSPEDIKEYFYEEIPAFIPTEFLSYNEIFATVGIMSSGLVYPSQIENNKTVSLLDLLEFNNNEDKWFYSNFLKEHSQGKVYFLKKDENFIKVLSNWYK